MSGYFGKLHGEYLQTLSGKMMGVLPQKRLLDLAISVSPAWGVSFVALTCRFQHTKTLSNVLEKEVNPILEVIYGGDLK